MILSLLLAAKPSRSENNINPGHTARLHGTTRFFSSSRHSFCLAIPSTTLLLLLLHRHPSTSSYTIHHHGRDSSSTLPLINTNKNTHTKHKHYLPCSRSTSARKSIRTASLTTPTPHTQTINDWTTSTTNYCSTHHAPLHLREPLPYYSTTSPRQQQCRSPPSSSRSPALSFRSPRPSRPPLDQGRNSKSVNRPSPPRPSRSLGTVVCQLR